MGYRYGRTWGRKRAEPAKKSYAPPTVREVSGYAFEKARAEELEDRAFRLRTSWGPGDLAPHAERVRHARKTLAAYVAAWCAYKRLHRLYPDKFTSSDLEGKRSRTQGWTQQLRRTISIKEAASRTPKGRRRK